MINKVVISDSHEPKPGSISLKFEIEPGSKLPFEFQIWLAGITGEHVFPGEREFHIPANVFLSRIDDFKSMRQRCGAFPIEYGDYFEELVAQYRKDIARLDLARGDTNARIPESDVIDGLKRAGFLRWNSQSEDQLRDIGRLAFLPNGANFSVPGAGKTNTLLAVHALARLERPNLKLVVACPKNAMLAWDEEVAACLGDSQKVVRIQGSRAQVANILSDGPEFSVVSYQKLSGATSELARFMRANEVHLVLDESHRIKAGQRSQQGAAALALADYAARRDILSGTPMPQGFADLDAQFKFLWPQVEIFRTISEDQDPAAQIRQANEDIRPYFVRTTKRELGLPKPEIRHVNIRMSESQRATWDLLKDESARYIARLDPEDKEELRAIGKQIMRVLQFCSDPGLLLKNLPPTYHFGELYRQLEVLESETSTKVQVLDDLVHKTLRKPGEKVVIWSMFVDQIERLKDRYAEFGATSIHGGVPTGPDDDLDFREARINHFKTSTECRVLVANPSACGEGISLHKEAHHAIYFDRSFNAAHFLQSIDRIHRRGLPEGTKTTIDILCLEGTIEEAVRKRLSDKIKLLQQLLDDEDLSAMVFDPEDVAEYGEDEVVSQSDLAEVMKSLSE